MVVCVWVYMIYDAVYYIYIYIWCILYIILYVYYMYIYIYYISNIYYIIYIYIYLCVCVRVCSSVCVCACVWKICVCTVTYSHYIYNVYQYVTIINHKSSDSPPISTSNSPKSAATVAVPCCKAWRSKTWAALRPCRWAILFTSVSSASGSC